MTNVSDSYTVRLFVLVPYWVQDTKAAINQYFSVLKMFSLQV